MNRAFYRYLARSLLWLLAVTLPLQGFASAMRSCCVDEIAVSMAAVHLQQQAQVQALAPQCHDMGDMGDTAGMQLKMAMDHGAVTQHGHDCSNHGACTVGASAPASMPGLHALTLRAPPPAMVPDSLFAGHIPSGPERPPRTTHSA